MKGGTVLKVLESTARKWLRDNDYNDIADMIDELIEEWNKTGKGTRRNWWEVLAGDKKGNSRVICGRTFPVLKTAQIRKGVTVTDNAICRNSDEKLPCIKQNNRWYKDNK